LNATRFEAFNDKDNFYNPVFQEAFMQATITRKRFFTLWAAPLMVLFAITGSAFLAAPAYAGLFDISEKEEIKAGQQVRQQAYKEYGRPLPANHPMSQRVKAIGQKFAKLSERKNIPYTYEVLQNDELLNAFAAPGGPVFVTTKLVKTAANDAELAYVIGHETGHIDRKHIVKAVEKQQKVGLIGGIAGAIFGIGNSDLFQIFGNVAFSVWSSGYSRDQESEADIVGARWMSQLGFDPNAAVSMMGRLGKGSGGISKYFATHPNPEDRQQSVRELIAKENLNDVARRSGGPFLTMPGLPEYSYTNTGAPNSPNDDWNRDNNADWSDDDFKNARRADWSNQLILVQHTEQNTIMAPVNAISVWADARLEVDERNTNVVTMRRGNNFVRLRRNSNIAVLNGRTIRLSAAAAVYNGWLYAPLGILVDGVGARAKLDEDRNTILLTLDGRRYTADVPRR
jgi:Zn-dependent protease with chaperone function